MVAFNIPFAQIAVGLMEIKITGLTIQLAVFFKVECLLLPVYFGIALVVFMKPVDHHSLFHGCLDIIRFF